MTYTSNLFLLSAVLALSMSFRVSTSRPLGKLIGLKSDLAARLNLDGESSTCWDSMFQLQACSSEVVSFFLNGETYIGDGCCAAIRTIEYQCWPALLGSLGFTTEETDILKGYCDEEAEQTHTPPTSPSPPSVPQPAAKFVAQFVP